MLIMIGHDNYVNHELIATVLKPGSAPAKRLRTDAAEGGRLIDATSGHKTRSILALTSGQIVLTAINPDTISARANTISKPKQVFENETY